MSSLIKKLALGGGVCIAIAFFMTRGTGSTTELFLWRAAAPFVHAGATVIDAVRDTLAVFGNARTLTARIEALEREKIALQAEKSYLENVAAENATLRAEAALPRAEEVATYPQRAADVIGYNPGATKEWIVINRGQSDDVAVGMPVVVGRVLVGVVAAVAPHTAQVRLITHAQSVIRGETAKLRTRGIVRGVSHAGAHVTMVERSQPLADGDVMLTVRNNALPGGLLLGTVYNVRVSDDSLFQEALLAPAYTAALRDRVTVLLTHKDF